MSYCLNPHCQQPQNPINAPSCANCGWKLLLCDRYRPLKTIGRGGFGRTFLAIDEYKPSHPSCVIKQFLPQYQDPDTAEKAAELFAREARRLDELGNHPQIPELLAYVTQNNGQYLVQEFIDGENLASELKREKAFSEDRIIQLLEDLLPVLQFIHGRSVIHRDIKPENIIRRRCDRQLVLVDFGAAKIITATALGQTGTAIGSAAYIPPEQMRGKAIFASDIYSLGATCLHLLTGIDPLELYDIIDNAWNWRQYLRSPVSDEIISILDKMVEAAIKQRYQSADEVLADLQQYPPQNYQALSPTKATIITEIEAGPQQSDFQRTITFAVAAPTSKTWECVNTLKFHTGRINSVAIGVQGKLLVSSSDKRIIVSNLKTGKYLQNLPLSVPVLSVAIHPEEQILVSGNLDKTITIRNLATAAMSSTLFGKLSSKCSHNGYIYYVAFSPEGDLLVSSSADKTIRLWDWRKGKLIKTLLGHEDRVWSVGFSPDGQTIASGSADKSIKIWNVRTGMLQRELKGHSGSVNAVAIDRDNQTLVSGSKDKTIKIWDLTTGKLINSLTGHTNSILSVAISPDSKTCASGSKDDTIKIWDLSSGQLCQTLSGHADAVKSVAFTPDGRSLVSGSWDGTLKIWQYN